MSTPYQYDEDLKVWIKKDYKSKIVYSDGDEVEDRIFRSVKKSKDVSCLSEELESEIFNWTSLCFLSKKRANLLRPFQSLFKGKRILEVGCGAGPICRFLGESGAEVYGLEPMIQRAKIAAERCRDLSNVKIFCDDIVNFDITEELDGIVMVGVLEYATRYSNKENAALDLLNNLKKFIKKDTGFIITAIENQLGLKYFSGFAEDHAGIFMHGINDNYRPGEATTYGRKVLIDIFQQAGFLHNDIYLPYPDYKLASLIFYPGLNEKIKNTDFNLDGILSGISYSDPQHKVGIFSMDKALPLVAKNDLLTDLSNSFCILSRFNQEETTQNPVICTLYNTEKKREHCKETSFEKEGRSVKIVRRHMDDQNNQVAKDAAISLPQQEIAYPGTVYYYEFVKIVNRPGWNVQEVGDWLATWFHFLKTELIANGHKDKDFANLSLKISAKYIDAVPINLVVHDGAHQFIDLELHLNEEIEIGYLVFRSILTSICRLSNMAAPGDPQYIEVSTLLKYLFGRLGYLVDERRLDEYNEKVSILDALMANSTLKPVKELITYLPVRPPLQDLLLNPAELFQLRRQNDEFKSIIKIQKGKFASLSVGFLELQAVIERLTAELNDQGK